MRTPTRPRPSTWYVTDPGGGRHYVTSEVPPVRAVMWQRTADGSYFVLFAWSHEQTRLLAGQRTKSNILVGITEVTRAHDEAAEVMPQAG